MRSTSLLCLGKLYIYISCVVVVLPLNLYYIIFCIDIFVHDTTVSELTCFICYTIQSSFVLHIVIFVLYIPCACVILPLCCCYIYV